VIGVHSIVLVILIPFVSTVVLALLNGHVRAERWVNVASCLGLTAFCFWLLATVDRDGIQVSTLGGFAAPYGIAFVADRLACVMLCLSASLASVVAVYTTWTVTDVQQRYFFFPLLQVMLLGVNWSFITGDLFNLFVAYEVLLLGSYGSMLVGASRQQVRQTMVYVAINLVGGSLFVVGIGLIYALVGTLNLADVARITSGLAGPRAAMVTAASVVLLFVFALKAGTFPLFFWLPDSYPVVPTGMNGYFAGLLTKVGIYSLLRVFVMTFRQEGSDVALHVLLVLSGFTMLLGVLGALAQWDIRRILSWHSVSQVGYMVMGIGLAIQPEVAVAAVAATVIFVVHHSIVKSCLFLVGGITEEATAARKLKDMGGVLELAPAVAALFLISALSLAGMPPFTGFLAKIALFRVGLAGGSFWIVAVAVVTSFFTLLSMLKIWSYAYWGEPRREAAVPGWHGMAAASAVLVVATIGLGLWAQPFLRLCNDLAHDLVHPTAYVEAVLGPTARLARVPTGGER
jgi:multicomponent Na+:H+ antiporter subunit D